jgi:membrane associated rhomboid family serine protease
MFCYRHPDREAYVRCQRCERLICPDCQVEASVGFLCVEDAGGSQRQNNVRALRFAPGRPVITQLLIAINLALYALQILTNGTLTSYLYYVPIATLIEPWRMITAGFIHSDSLFSDPSSVLHILLNMYSLWIFGQVLEPMLGRARFLALYLISIFGGSVAVLWFGNVMGGVVGASGGIFGLMGAYFVVLRSLGVNSSSMVGVIGINLVFTFLNPGISWQAHVGGLVIGALVTYVYSQTRNVSQQKVQTIALIAISVALVAASYIRAEQIMSGLTL